MENDYERRWYDCAYAKGMPIKSTGGEGENTRQHYIKFEFRSREYGLEDSVMLNPMDINQKPYVAIIKDIYIQGEDEEVKMEVQWFYRPEDVDKKYVRNWRSKDSRHLFYSFHRDEVDAESVREICMVDFVPTNKQIPNPTEDSEFIVQKVYDIFQKKLLDFDRSNFNEFERNEIGLLVAKTISRVGQLLDIEKKKKRNLPDDHLPDTEKTSFPVSHLHNTDKVNQAFKSKRKQYVPRRVIQNVESTNPEKGNLVNASEFRSGEV